MKVIDESLKQPLVSVVVPAYNVEQYIDECISSLLGQSYKNLEIIIIDDGSNDNTGTLIRMYKDERLRIIHKENGGLVSARKLGLRLAKGKYIGFVDGDDYVGVDFIKNLVDEIEKSNFDFVHEGFCEDIDGDICRSEAGFDEEFVFKNTEEKIGFIEEYVFSSSSKRWISSSIWSKLFRADFIKCCYEIVPDAQSYGEDLICLIISLMRCHSFSVISRNDYRYRVRNNSMSHIDNQKFFYKEVELCTTISKLEDVVNNKALFDCVYLFLRKRIKSAWDKSVIYCFPDIKIVKDKRIVIYGAGRVGNDYYNQLKDVCKELVMVDQNSLKLKGQVLSPEELVNLSYDYILIAVENNDVVMDIKCKLEKMGITAEKVIYSIPEKR